MTHNAPKKNLQKTFIFCCGMILMVVGVALILHWWPYLVVVFKGVAGMALALAALCLFVLAKE